MKRSVTVRVDRAQQVHDGAGPSSAGFAGPGISHFRRRLQDLHPDLQDSLVRALAVALRRHATPDLRLQAHREVSSRLENASGQVRRVRTQTGEQHFGFSAEDNSPADKTHRG